MRCIHLFAASLILLITGSADAAELASSVDAAKLPKGKTTSLGLYLTATDTHAAITADPGIVYVDVRDPIEIAFVGRPEGIDAIVPLNLFSSTFDAGKGRLAASPNKDFIAQIDRIMQREGKSKDDPLVVACRSGGRSARAANMLAEAGYTRVYNQIEGFEGDWNKETGSRDRNGWRNAGLPWTMKLDARVAWQP